MRTPLGVATQIANDRIAAVLPSDSPGRYRGWVRRYCVACTRVSEVLNRKRGLSLDMIRKLHDKVQIPAEVLIRSARGLKSRREASA